MQAGLLPNEPIGRGIDKLLNKFKGVPDTLKGITIIEGVDLIVLILIVPVASCALTYILIKYGIEIPFGAAAEFLGEQLSALASKNRYTCCGNYGTYGGI